jgi:type I pantothenate kinase
VSTVPSVPTMTHPSALDDLAPLAELVAARVAATDGPSLLVGMAGGVSVGKSTTAAQISTLLAERHGLTTAVVASDGFLLSTSDLATRGLTERKGFPESYDHDAIEAFLTAVKDGVDPIEVPVYDHLFYDVLPEPEFVPRAPVVIFEGVNVLRFADDLDLGVYVDAAEPDMRRWYVDRVLDLRARAVGVPGAYLAQYATLDDETLAAIAVSVWESINLPNLRDCIEPTRDRADVMVTKGPDHSIAELRLR